MGTSRSQVKTVPLEQVVFGGKTVEVVHKVKTHPIAVAPKPSVYCVQPEPFFPLSRPQSMDREGTRDSDLNVMRHTREQGPVLSFQRVEVALHDVI